MGGGRQELLLALVLLKMAAMAAEAVYTLHELTCRAALATIQQLPSPPAPTHPSRGMSDVDRLGTVERYFVEVKGIPRLAERIRCFIFSRTYAATRTKVGGGGGSLGMHFGQGQAGQLRRQQGAVLVLESCAGGLLRCQANCWPVTTAPASLSTLGHATAVCGAPGGCADGMPRAPGLRLLL